MTATVKAGRKKKPAKKTTRKQEYKAHQGRRLSDEQVQRYGEEMARISESESGLTAESLVEAARSPRNVLHEFIFEKSDGDAAEEYRLIQARFLLRSVDVPVYYGRNDKKSDPEYHRAFHPVMIETNTGESERRYVPLSLIQGSKALQKQMHEMALRDLAAFQKRYDSILISCQSKNMIAKVAQRIRAAAPQ